MFKEHYWGIYFCDKAVMGMGIKRIGKKKWHIYDEFQLKLPSSIIINGQIKEEKKLKELLQPLLPHQKLPQLKVNLAFDTNQLNNRLVAMPLLDQWQLAEAVKWEMLPFLTGEKEDNHIAHVRLQQLTNNTLQEQVYMAATPKILIADYLQLIKKLKLIPWRIETIWIQLFRLWHQLKRNFQYLANCSRWCLFFADSSGKAYIVTNSSEQGFAVRQIVIGSDYTLAEEELSHVFNYLENKYAIMLEKIVLLGEESNGYQQLLDRLGKQLILINWDTFFHGNQSHIEVLDNIGNKASMDGFIPWGLILGEIADGTD